MGISEQSCCGRCQAVLRRGGGSRGQAWCDPCRRAGLDPRRDLPAGFYSQDVIVAALADYDWGTVFRRVRMATQWSQQSLGELLGLDQPRISLIERGGRRLRDVALVAQVATALCIPPTLLGFGTTVSTAGGDEQKLVRWVDRRDFVQQIATLTLGATGIATLDIDRLTALLPHADPTGTRHVGASDVAVIEQATAAFMSQDFATGAGPIRDLAVAQLRAVLPLLDAQSTPEVQSRLLVATTELATMAGWMSFEVNQHDAARRLWMIGLNIARSADHPRSSDLTAFLLNDMAQQALHLDRPDEALRLIYLSHTTTTGSHPVSAATNCCLANIEARIQAAKKDTASCDRALGQATEHLSNIDPATTPPLVAHVGKAALSSSQGAARYTLALASHDPHAATQATSLLRTAVDHLGADYGRLRATTLTDLAGAHAIAGDTDTAVTLGHQAIDAVTALHSLRAYDRLRVLHTALQPCHTSTGVTELRDRLSATTSAPSTGTTT
ncbi:MAG: helix-turn-helix domain-containing protein [Pseudonocardiaceae bacterium]